MSYQKVIISGNLANDPEILYTPKGTPVCRFTVATSERYNDENHPSFHRCVVFGKSAEAIQKFFQKGRGITLDGRLKYKTYQNRDYPAVTMYLTEIWVNEWSFVNAGGNLTQQRIDVDNPPSPLRAPDDDIPF